MIKQKPKNTILSIIAIAILLVILELIGRSKIDRYYIGSFNIGVSILSTVLHFNFSMVIPAFYLWDMRG